MKKVFHRPAFTLLIVSMFTALFLQGTPCFAATGTGALPWDQTLTALQDIIAGPVARRVRLEGMKSSPMPEIPYTVRLARDRGIAPRKLIRAVLAEHFGGDGRPSLGGPIDESNQHPSLDQILFDLTRTRLTLQHLLDHQVGSEATDQIRRTSQQEAERYMHRLRRRTI